METNIQVFSNSQFGEIRTAVSADNEPLFCLADVCNALDLKNPRSVKTTLRQDGVHTMDGVSRTTNQHGKTTEQVVSLNFITEPNLYKCIFQSRKKEAEKFQDWVCGEILPSIRKHGGYMVAQPDETPETIMARALLVAQETINRQKARADELERKARQLEKMNNTQNEMLEARSEHIRFLMPAASFAHAVKSSGHSILIGELATILKQNGVDTGQNRLFTYLRDHGWLCRSRGERYNLPTQKALNMGLLEIKKTAILKPDGTTLVTSTPKVSGKGQIYFINQFLGLDSVEALKGGEQ